MGTTISTSAVIIPGDIKISFAVGFSGLLTRHTSSGIESTIMENVMYEIAQTNSVGMPSGVSNRQRVFSNQSGMRTAFVSSPAFRSDFVSFRPFHVSVWESTNMGLTTGLLYTCGSCSLSISSSIFLAL